MMNSTYDHRTPGQSAYANNTPLFMTPLNRDFGISASPMIMNSPKYTTSLQQSSFVGGMSNVFSPVYANPTARLSETPIYVPAGLNPYDKPNATPVTMFGRNAVKEEPYRLSPSYSPIASF